MSVEYWVEENPVLEERMPQLEEAEEAKRLLATFKEITSSERRVPRAYRVHLQKFPDRSSLRIYRQTSQSEQSVIIESEVGNRGEIRFIEADKRKGLRVYAHTQTAVRKAGEFLDEFRRALRAS